MDRLTHQELAAAKERKDWTLLWQQAMPSVKWVVRKLKQNGVEDPHGDVEQEGMLIAGEAMRTWRPIECAFSTHISNTVRYGLLKHLGRERNHGIGSHEQQAVVLSSGDARDESGTQTEGSFDDEETDDGSFDAALTYNGVLRRYTGQYDGMGEAPEGFGDPEEEAERAKTTEVLRAAIDDLPLLQAATVSAAHGFGGTAMPLREYAAVAGLSYGMVQRAYAAGIRALGQKLPNSYHK
jgi:RNA polymerase sigma factor (sigma-70 family)